ncbi:hypothetical protein D3C73_595290 [compost metagenome]
MSLTGTHSNKLRFQCNGFNLYRNHGYFGSVIYCTLVSSRSNGRCTYSNTRYYTFVVYICNALITGSPLYFRERGIVREHLSHKLISTSDRDLELLGVNFYASNIYFCCIQLELIHGLTVCGSNRNVRFSFIMYNQRDIICNTALLN